jgi:signal transduction histidine kinase
MLKDAINFLEYSQFLFLSIMFVLALLDNVFIRSFVESIVRTTTFFLLIFIVMLLRKTRLLINNVAYLVAMGILPVIGSELLSDSFGFEGSWTATALITLVAPAVIISLSVLSLSLRDHKLIIELLDTFDLTQSPSRSRKFDVGERQLASFLHNSLQSELLAVAGQLEDAANSNDQQKSAEILQKVNSLINRSFIDDFHNFSESPLERLETIRNSWKGILNIHVDIPDMLLQSQERNLVLVQTIEEFVANSFRHSKATEISVNGISDEFGIRLTLVSNGVRKISKRRGLGSEWLDQIGRSQWKLQSTRNETRLEVTI